MVKYRYMYTWHSPSARSIKMCVAEVKWHAILHWSIVLYFLVLCEHIEPILIILDIEFCLNLLEGHVHCRLLRYVSWNTIRKHTYPNILKMLPPKHRLWYSLELPRRGGSNEYPQSMFLIRNKKINVYPCKPQFLLYQSGVQRGSKLYRHIFMMFQHRNFSNLMAQN